MSWMRLYGFSGYVGAAVCGSCLVKSCFGSDRGKVFAGESNEDAEVPSIRERGLKLKQVQVFFRHGARTPIHQTPGIEQGVYRADIHSRDVPYTVFNYQLRSLDGKAVELSPYEAHYRKTLLQGGCFPGSLTALGQDQMYMLGQDIRHQYIERHKLMGPHFQQEHVYVRSTNINRALNSARCVLAGVFGVQELSARDPPIFNISPVSVEILLPNPHNCELVKTVNHASMIHFDSIPGIKADREKLEAILGYDSEKSKHKLNFIFVRDDMFARQAHGLMIPPKLRPHLEMIDANGTKIMYNAFCGQHEAERLLAMRMSAGLALTMAVKEMTAAVNSTSSRKLCLYSTHDSLILPLLVIMDIFDEKWPPFAADIRLELYTDQEGEHWVRVLYLGKEQVIRGCQESLVKYSDFLNCLKPYLIEREEYSKLCVSKVLEKIAKDLLVHEKDEVDDEETRQTSDTPAGL